MSERKTLPSALANSTLTGAQAIDYRPFAVMPDAELMR